MGNWLCVAETRNCQQWFQFLSHKLHFPVVPFSEKCVESVTVMMNVPFAAVFPGKEPVFNS